MADREVRRECPASCGACSEEQLRATVSGAPGAWPTAPHSVERAPENASDAWLAHRIARAGIVGPLIIPAALGAHFDPEAWTRPRLHARCSPGVNAPPPSPPWPTIAYRQPSAIGKRWAGLHFENGAALSVFDLPSLLDGQDSGRLRGVVLFDSPANRTCPALLQRAEGRSTATNANDDANPIDMGGLPAPRFFPRDFEVALGGPRGEGLWRKGGTPWDDPDIFVSKAGTRTHVHIDAHCTRFWMLGLSGRKVRPRQHTHMLHTCRAAARCDCSLAPCARCMHAAQCGCSFVIFRSYGV